MGEARIRHRNRVQAILMAYCGNPEALKAIVVATQAPLDTPFGHWTPQETAQFFKRAQEAARDHQRNAIAQLHPGPRRFPARPGTSGAVALGPAA